jgi:hypothetical protein
MKCARGGEAPPRVVRSSNWHAVLPLAVLGKRIRNIILQASLILLKERRDKHRSLPAQQFLSFNNRLCFTSPLGPEGQLFRSVPELYRWSRNGKNVRKPLPNSALAEM